MAYGIIKVDNITFDNGGSDQNVTVSGLYRATTSGVTVSGTIAATTVSGVTVIGSTTVSGATVTGTTANFTSGNFSNLNSAAATVSGSLVMTNQQQVRFREAAGNGVNYIALQATASVASDKIITLPDVTGTAITTGDNGTVTSSMIADGTIVNADINASAAIALSKLATGALPSGITVASANIVDGTIVNADINASAAIVDTKLDTIATAGKVSNSATTATDANTASAIVARSAEGNFNITSINGGPLAGFRNAIINGGFDIWQRSTSAGHTGPYNTADRWYNEASGGTGRAVTYSRQAFTPGQTDVPGEPAYFFRWNETNAGSGYAFKGLWQAIEGARTFAGQQVTLSFYAKSNTSRNVPVQLDRDYGAGGSTYETLSIGSPVAAVTTSWQKFTFTFTVPGLGGKTIGTGDDALWLAWVLPVTGTFTFDIAQVQLEPGPVATPFERRPIGVELALCQRYFCKSYNVDVNPGTITDTGKYEISSPVGGGTLSIGTVAIFPVTMRNNPTVTVYNPNTGASNSMRRDTTAVTPTIQNEGSASVSISSSSGAAARSINFHYTASAEL